MDFVKLRDEVQKRHGSRLVRTNREPCRDTVEHSFTVDAYLPWRDKESTRWQSASVVAHTPFAPCHSARCVISCRMA